MSTVDFETVKKIVVEQLSIEGEKVDLINLESRFVNDLGADSLDTVELVMALEEEFDIEIPDDVAERILTIQDAINFINEQKKTAD